MSMTRRNFLKSAALFPLMYGLGGTLRAAFRTPAAQLPNILLIVSDDQGWGDLSFTGNPNFHTPNIDRLGEDGVSFDRFYVCPVCSPTRAELLTGRYSARGGVYSTSAGGERLDLDETTMGDVFKRAGYATAAFGKWHNGMQYPYHPNARGFDEFYGFCSGHWGNYFSPMLEHNGKLVTGIGYLTNDLTEHALDFMKSHRQQPFFVYLPYNVPHTPFQVPDKWWNQIDEEAIVKSLRNPGQENIHATHAALAMCENVDWNVGRLVDTIESLGITENTIVIYFSDNGPNTWRWNNGMKGKKGWLDEGGVRSPLFMKWPGTISPGKKIPQITGVIDVLPTLSDLAGIACHTAKPLDGESITPLLLEENPEWSDRFLVTYWQNKISLRNQRYRLDNEGHLYDIVTDPGQYRDVAKEQPRVAAAMQREAKRWKEELDAELPDKDPRPFPIGHPDFAYTQLPARDGIPHGGVERSNRFPNCTFFTNWTSGDDAITWDTEVLASGDFEVIVYYTCPAADVGSTFELRFGSDAITGKITEAHDPPLRGMEHDRVKRQESYVKDFEPLNIGTMHLEKGKGLLTLHALKIPGSQVMDFRLMMFRRVG